MTCRDEIKMEFFKFQIESLKILSIVEIRRTDSSKFVEGKICVVGHVVVGVHVGAVDDVIHVGSQLFRRSPTKAPVNPTVKNILKMNV